MWASEELSVHSDKPIGRENHRARQLGGLYGEEGGGESTWTNDLRVQGRHMGGVGALGPIERIGGSGQG